MSTKLGHSPSLVQARKRRTDDLVRNYGTTINVRIADVIRYESSDKYVDVTYFDPKTKQVRTKTVTDTLKRITAEQPEFVLVARGVMVRKDDIKELEKIEGTTTFRALCESHLSKAPFKVRVSRRGSAVVRKILKDRKTNATE